MIDKIFFVDCENVGFPDISKMVDEDEIYTVLCFHNERAKCPKVPNVKYIKCNVSGIKNGLDFVLCTVLGDMIRAYGRDTQYIIVSNDKGYLSAVRYWTDVRGYNVVIEKVALADKKPVKVDKSVKVDKPTNAGKSAVPEEIVFTDRALRKGMNIFLTLTDDKKVNPNEKVIRRFMNIKGVSSKERALALYQRSKEASIEANTVKNVIDISTGRNKFNFSEKAIKKGCNVYSSMLKCEEYKEKTANERVIWLFKRISEVKSKEEALALYDLCRKASGKKASAV